MQWGHVTGCTLGHAASSRVVCVSAHADGTNPSAKRPPRYGRLNTPEEKAITACLQAGESK